MLYVALSRVQSLDKLVFRDVIPLKAFQTKWPTELKRELKRLKKIEQVSMATALAKFPPISPLDHDTLQLESRMNEEECMFLNK